jgi:hypothetical protein
VVVAPRPPPPQKKKKKVKNENKNKNKNPPTSLFFGFVCAKSTPKKTTTKRMSIHSLFSVGNIGIVEASNYEEQSTFCLETSKGIPRHRH